MVKKTFKRNKAFTLIEIISVIVIIGIFLLLAFPLISSAISATQLKYFENQENTLLISGRNYFTYDRSRLPKTEGEKNTVTLTTLIDEGYVKPILDTKNKNCHFDESSVTVTNLTKGEYQYDVRLVCDEYDTQSVLDEWSEWSAEEPTENNIEVQSGIFYNYQEPTTYYGEWSDWSDVVAIKDDALRTVSEVIGTDTENRTVYRYQDQQWKWYKVDTEYSSCVSTSPGADWVFSETGSCQPVQESTTSCSASAPDGTYSSDYRCADAPTPPNNGACAWSTPSAVSGGTWSRGSSCDHDHWYECPSGYDLSGTSCTFYDSYGISTTKDYSCPPGGWVVTNCIGWCEAPTPTGYTKTWNEISDPCPPCYGLNESCTRYWSGTMSRSETIAATQYTDYAYTYTWTATPTYVWKHTVNTGIYSRTGNIYATEYSSTSPTGYSTKDTAQTQYTTWTEWDVNVPASFDFRTPESKPQKRTRSIIKDWSGNALPGFVMEVDLITQLGKPLAEISADPNIKLITQTMYRYRVKRI